METVIFNPEEIEAIYSGTAYYIEHWDMPMKILWLMEETRFSINRVILKLGFPIDPKDVECEEYKVTVLAHYSDTKEDKRPKRVCIHCGKALEYNNPDDITDSSLDNNCVGKISGYFGFSNHLRVFDFFVCNECVKDWEKLNRITEGDKD